MTARAVAEARVLAELCLPLVAVGGFWVAAKGADPHDEVRKLRFEHVLCIVPPCRRRKGDVRHHPCYAARGHDS